MRNHDFLNTEKFGIVPIIRSETRQQAKDCIAKRCMIQEIPNKKFINGLVAETFRFTGSRGQSTVTYLDGMPRVFSYKKEDNGS